MRGRLDAGRMVLVFLDQNGGSFGILQVKHFPTIFDISAPFSRELRYEQHVPCSVNDMYNVCLLQACCR